MRMFRTVFASLSVSGVSLAKSFFSLSASESLQGGNEKSSEKWIDPIEKIGLEEDDLEDGSEWMAEPLTDKVFINDVTFGTSNSFGQTKLILQIAFFPRLVKNTDNKDFTSK